MLKNRCVLAGLAGLTALYASAQPHIGQAPSDAKSTVATPDTPAAREPVEGQASLSEQEAERAIRASALSSTFHLQDGLLEAMLDALVKASLQNQPWGAVDGPLPWNVESEKRLKLALPPWGQTDKLPLPFKTGDSPQKNNPAFWAAPKKDNPALWVALGLALIAAHASPQNSGPFGWWPQETPSDFGRVRAGEARK